VLDDARRRKNRIPELGGDSDVGLFFSRKILQSVLASLPASVMNDMYSPLTRYRLKSSSCISSSCLETRIKVVAHRPGSGSIAFDLRTSAMTSLKEIASTSQVRSKIVMISFAQAATAPANRPVQNPAIWTGPVDCLEPSLCSLSLYLGQSEVARCSTFPDLQHERPEAGNQGENRCNDLVWLFCLRIYFCDFKYVYAVQEEGTFLRS
jgi:hypothetical protein